MHDIARTSSHFSSQPSYDEKRFGQILFPNGGRLLFSLLEQNLLASEAVCRDNSHGELHCRKNAKVDKAVDAKASIESFHDAPGGRS